MLLGAESVSFRLPPIQVRAYDLLVLLGFGYIDQVGAGTMNPLTFLRVLGPEPWNVA